MLRNVTECYGNTPTRCAAESRAVENGTVCSICPRFSVAGLGDRRAKSPRFRATSRSMEQNGTKWNIYPPHPLSRERVERLSSRKRNSMGGVIFLGIAPVGRDKGGYLCIP